LAATLGLAAVAWIIAISQMTGMDMGIATELGSVGSFAALWVPMMAAMMLPGAVPAVLGRVGAGGRLLDVALFVGSYLAIWAIAGLPVYLLYRPHGYIAAGVIVIAAGGYELTPLKRYFRRRCRDSGRSGIEFALCCVGSSIGLMLILLALGPMNAFWMIAVTVVVTAQKLLPPIAAIDLPLALAIVGLGVWILIAPTAVPGLTPPM
jgi:predicted metal-binding membrane protein